MSEILNIFKGLACSSFLKFLPKKSIYKCKLNQIEPGFTSYM